MFCGRATESWNAVLIRRMGRRDGDIRPVLRFSYDPKLSDRYDAGSSNNVAPLR